MYRGSLHTRSFRRIHLTVFRYRWTRNGFTGPKSFRGFRETGPWAGFKTTRPTTWHDPSIQSKTSIWSLVNSKKHVASTSSKLEPAIWSCDTGQRIPWFDRCQLAITGMSNIREGRTERACLCQPISWSKAAILRDSVVVVVVVRKRPRARPLAMITMRKSIHGFPFLSYMGMGLRLAALRAAGAPL